MRIGNRLGIEMHPIGGLSEYTGFTNCRESWLIFQVMWGRRNHLIICVPFMTGNSSSQILPWFSVSKII